MKRIFCLLLTLIAISSYSAPTWTTDYQSALSGANTDGKYVLLDFTGSDWCSWCIKLDKDVLTSSEFESFAKDNLNLVKVDFPRKALEADQASQNQQLKNRFGIQGFPTLILINKFGKEIGRQTGYVSKAATLAWLSQKTGLNIVKQASE